jgi:TATA-box binding protein (TBP) (component of TFIID and TFIIIB)
MKKVCNNIYKESLTKELIDTNAIKIETEKLNNALSIDNKPAEVKISTMTITCKFNTEFMCGNIARYIYLSNDEIQEVRHGVTTDLNTNRSILPIKKKIGKKKKSKKIFFNQVSLSICIPSKDKNINVKIFSNGAVQMTGCKIVQNAIDVIIILIKKFSETKGLYNKTTKSIVDKPFVKDLEEFKFNKIKKFKIQMINSNFGFPAKIDRIKLYKQAKFDELKCEYEPMKHACVNIKYSHPDRDVSIFVFEKGSIIITGAQNCSHILDAYNFINKYLLTNYLKIVKNDAVINSNIKNFMDNKKKEIEKN